MSEGREETLVERWINRLKNYRLVAIVVLIVIIVGGIATFIEDVQKILKYICPTAVCPTAPIARSWQTAAVPQALKERYGEQVGCMNFWFQVKKTPQVKKYMLTIKIKRVDLELVPPFPLISRPGATEPSITPIWYPSDRLAPDSSKPLSKVQAEWEIRNLEEGQSKGIKVCVLSSGGEARLSKGDLVEVFSAQ